MVGNLYHTLGSVQTATPEELRSAYRRLALRYHPDVSDAPKAVAERVFITIKDAYDVLSDPSRRALYDVWLATHSVLSLSSPLNREPVSSSNLRSVGYDSRAMVLEVEFHNGSIYQYLSVPAALYEGLMHASSKGRFLHQYILSRFPYQRVG